ncbi:Ankyrin repeat domain-containing protein 13C [Trichoplax sp. H2]|nr:Ankyrin repeat domain-containing protein 13C [Trichoplax sp. H2]|eukprot:RDD43687.1 Ankyrin repeat domain-containing protein 13C [Trichoplax sp. H2]
MAQNTTLDYPVHYHVFNGNANEMVKSLQKGHDINRKDKHGNTPLHLAVMLGHKDCIKLLLQRKPSLKAKNNYGWTPLDEAISYGDRLTVTQLLLTMKTISKQDLKAKRPRVIAALKSLGDFYMELKWEFTSWIPFLSRLLPSDICKIRKRDACIRVDSTLADFSEMKWQRGDVSLIFNGNNDAHPLPIVLDNDKKTFQKMRFKDDDAEVDEEVDLLMSNNIVSGQTTSEQVTFTKVQSGWIFRENKIETIGNFKADVFSVNGLQLIQRKRREHLSEEDKKKNKELMKKISKGDSKMFDEDYLKPEHRMSLEPPAKCKMTWQEYLESRDMPQLARLVDVKETRKAFKPQVAMSQEFPLDVNVLVDILTILSPMKQFTKLKEFIQMKLPPGFPVKLELSILPTITAKVSFQEYSSSDDIPVSIFFIPRDYKEELDT